ncbi:MAG: vitamin K epoxide reductase family protein [Candidatus Nanoarchaeia archaeon]
MASILFSAYLGYIAFYKLRVWCPVCIAIYLVNFAMLIVLI